jgi:hypothetical protein
MHSCGTAKYATNDFVSEQKCDTENCVTYMFFTFHLFFDLYNFYSYEVLSYKTYKKNKYWLPLISIVEITGGETTILIYYASL